MHQSPHPTPFLLTTSQGKGSSSESIFFSDVHPRLSVGLRRLRRRLPPPRFLYHAIPEGEPERCALTVLSLIFFTSSQRCFLTLNLCSMSWSKCTISGLASILRYLLFLSLSLSFSLLPKEDLDLLILLLGFSIDPAQSASQTSFFSRGLSDK